MIENFIEYMWYLLTTPLKKLKKALNKWYILCRVFGKRFDEAKEDILRELAVFETSSPSYLLMSEPPLSYKTNVNMVVCRNTIYSYAGYRVRQHYRCVFCQNYIISVYVVPKTAGSIVSASSG